MTGVIPRAGVESHGAHYTNMSGIGLPSRHLAGRCMSDIQPALEAIRCGRLPYLDSLAWPAGLDRSILKNLSLTVRTQNCLMGAGFMEGDSSATVQEVMLLPNFGRRSLKDLLLKTEEFLKQCVHWENTDPLQVVRVNENTPNYLLGNVEKDIGADASSMCREHAAALLSKVLATAAELHGVETLAHGLSEKTMRLAGMMGIAEEIDAIRIDEMTDGAEGLVSASSRELERIIDGATETERKVIEQRLLHAPPRTLEYVGYEAGVTRERIRQIQARVERKIWSALGGGLQAIASTLKDEFGNLVSQSELESRIEKLLAKQQGVVKKLFGRALIEGMGFTLCHGLYLDGSARRELEEIRAATRRLADDVGLVDTDQVVASFPNDDWGKWWPWVRERCGLSNLFGSLAIRESGKAWVKAALISLGRPATRDEIAEMCGFGRNKVGSHLSVIPSVVKADKERWGLKEWVDDEYEGIVGEIIQRIEEEGGSTTTKRLLTELPEKFGVNPVSVRAYLQTPKFVVRDGWVSLASRTSLQLRSLDDVVDGRDPEGAPYWTFVVEPRFFDGYSVTGVPPEFAHALGCQPDAGEDVRVENLPQRRVLSLRWPLASTTGASLGYLADSLRGLGVEAGDRVRVTIKAPRIVTLSVDQGGAEDSEPREADVILERLMQRRRVL